jgi:uncharacterized protein (DUF1697 family)
MNYKFKEETLGGQNREVLEDLLRTNYEESHYAHLGEYGADVDFFIKAEELDMLKFYTLRVEEELLGYAVFLFVNHPHIKDTIVAKQETLYVKEDVRGHGHKFYDYVEGELKKSGAKGLITSMQAGKDHTKYFESKGFEFLERVYLKEF